MLLLRYSLKKELFASCQIYRLCRIIMLDIIYLIILVGSIDKFPLMIKAGLRENVV